MSAWHEDARRVDFFQVSHELGIERTRDGKLTPCPGCGERLRSKNDDRLGPVYMIYRDTRWRCGRCDRRGDSLDLVAMVLRGTICDPEAVPAVRAWFAARGWCEPDPGGPSPEKVTVREAPAQIVEREPAPPEEVAELWERCERVGDSSTAQDWLRSRALDPTLVEERDLCRVLPVGGALPAWARHWEERFPCPVLLPLYGPTGSLVGLQGRRVDGARPKSVAAQGVRRIGVYADAVGIALLRWGARPGWWEGCAAVLAEGEPDFLTWATRYPDTTDAPAVFGFPGSGAWTPSESARLPSGLTVAIRAHLDEAGRKYADRIAKTLVPRCKVLVRHVLEEQP